MVLGLIPHLDALAGKFGVDTYEELLNAISTHIVGLDFSVLEVMLAQSPDELVEQAKRKWRLRVFDRTLRSGFGYIMEGSDRTLSIVTNSVLTEKTRRLVTCHELLHLCSYSLDPHGRPYRDIPHSSSEEMFCELLKYLIAVSTTVSQSVLDDLAKRVDVSIDSSVLNYAEIDTLLKNYYVRRMESMVLVKWSLTEASVTIEQAMAPAGLFIPRHKRYTTAIVHAVLPEVLRETARWSVLERNDELNLGSIRGRRRVRYLVGKRPSSFYQLIYLEPSDLYLASEWRRMHHPMMKIRSNTGEGEIPAGQSHGVEGASFQ